MSDPETQSRAGRRFRWGAFGAGIVGFAIVGVIALAVTNPKGLRDFLFPDKTPPVVTLPADITVGADAGSDGAIVHYAAAAEDARDGVVTPTLTRGLLSGKKFPIGATVVGYKAKDEAGNESVEATFTVTVVDKEAPVIKLEAPKPVEAVGPTGAPVEFTIAASDNSGDVIKLEQSAQSGAVFPVGSTDVSVKATDTAGNASEATLKIVVTDTTPPAVTAPASLALKAAPGADGAVATFEVSATDIVDGAITPVLTQGLASGAKFPIGVTTVGFKATDKAGNESPEATFTVTVTATATDGPDPVVDTIPPVILISNPAPVRATGPAGAKVDFEAKATDNSGAPVKIEYRIQPGSVFPIGVTKVGIAATDAAGNRASVVIEVTVLPQATDPTKDPTKDPADTDFKGFFGPVGSLLPGSGRGVVDRTVYAPGMRFPIERSPAYANSQVWGVGGFRGPRGGQCDKRNFRYPWRDNFCETRSGSNSFCRGGRGHQGQDIRPGTCKKDKHWAVAVEDGTITHLGSYTVTLRGASGREYRYLHLNMRRLAIRRGQRVKRGQRIGLVSNFFGGTPTTIHLHFEIRLVVQDSKGRVRKRFVPPYTSLVDSYKRLISSGL
ncbi:MAG: HYR domain-containing protein [Neomegalonema sp.]|nr:HYR domain-containing protein [Neomegalonema sp.]